MLELITQYGPYAFIALAAVFLYAAGHHVGSATAAALVPETIKTAEDAAPKDTVLNKIGQDGKVELELVPKKADAPTPTRALADEAVARDPAIALSVHQTLTESLTAAGHLDVKSADPASDNLDKILPTKVLASAPLADIQESIASAQTKVADDITIAEYKKLTKPAGVDAEVSKAHDALDKAGVFGPNRLIAIAAVRAGQVTGDDVARAHPVQQEAKVPFGAVGLPSQDTTVATSAAPGQVQ